MAEERLAKPLGDRVLLTELESEVSQTAGGIIIPDSVKNEDIKSLRIPCKRTIAELEEEAATEAYFEICEKNFAVYDSYLDEYYKACDSAKFILECDQKEAGHI